MSKLNRLDYSNSLRELADTVLYETAIVVNKDIIKEGRNPSSDCHWKNSAIYQEFWRREKADAYFDAYNRVQLEFKGPNAVVKNPISNKDKISNNELVKPL